jgi:hypothetical protein
VSDETNYLQKKAEKVIEFNRLVREAANSGEIDLNPPTLDGFGDQIVKILRIAFPEGREGNALRFRKKN